MAARLNENMELAMPLRNIVTLIIVSAFAVYGYFEMQNRISDIETKYVLMATDLEKNTEFRIKWPRGEMGSLPTDSEQFMLIEHLSKEHEKLVDKIENGKAPFDQQQQLILEFYERRITEIETKINEMYELSGGHGGEMDH